MIAPITDPGQIKWILGVSGYSQGWPENLPVPGHSVILGAFTAELVGCFPVQFYFECAEIHVAFHPDYRGEFAVESAKEAFRWVWDNTNYHTIVADIESPHVARYAKRCGMKQIGERYEVSKWAVL